MNKNKKIVICIIFFMSIFLTSVIFMQFKIVEQTNLTDIENMNEEELQKEVISWQNKLSEVENKLNDVRKTYEEYESLINNNKNTSELLDKELNNLAKIAGETDVYGDGQIITLEDNENQRVSAGALLNLVNELKYAGAEAISINGIRIVNFSDIVDVNYVIQIQGQKISSPYIVKCIGKQEYLENTLNSKNGYIETYSNSGITLKMESKKNIKIDRYSGNYDTKYLVEK